ncbi:hypothetical protein ACNI65_17100 [Roseateles sp. So40a]|uniref:hypothetical protein n=1 Tax=Roseateles sp. So40a TaxID=3400226 RepID=UPI003A87590A
MNIQTLASRALATALCGFCVAVQAAPSNFSPGELSVFAHAQVVAPGLNPRVYVGNPVQVSKASTLSFKERVSVRVFALPAKSDIPVSWARFEPCLVYWSTLYQVRFGPDGVVTLFNPGLGWLQLTDGGQLETQRYLLVFEQGDGDGDHMVRIRNDQVNDYFSKGLVISIESVGDYPGADRDEMLRKRKAQAAALQAAADDNVKKHRCYVVKAPQLANASTQPAGGVAENVPMGPTIYAMNDCEPEVSLP